MDVRVGLWRKLSAKELMLLNCGVEKTLESPLDSKEIQPVQPKNISPEYSLEGLMLKLKLQYFGHLVRRTDSLERFWCWERLKAGEGDNRGWGNRGCMASPTKWTWVWVDSRSWWWTGRPGMLQFMGLQRLDTTEWLNWTRGEKSILIISDVEQYCLQGAGPGCRSWQVA